MKSLLVVGLLFLAGAAYNIFGSEPDHNEALAGSGIAAALIGIFFLSRHHAKVDREFEDWLLRNAVAIEQDGAPDQGILIRPGTITARYQATLSLLFITFRIPTRVYIVDHHSAGGASLGARSTQSKAVSRNLRGGLRETVGARLRGLSQSMPPA